MNHDPTSLLLALIVVRYPVLVEEKSMNQHPTTLYEITEHHRGDMLRFAMQQRLAAQAGHPRRSHIPGAPALAHAAHSLGLALDRLAVALCDDCFDTVSR